MPELRIGIFGKLPREIRDEIYKLVLLMGRIHLQPEVDLENHRLFKYTKLPAVHPELLRVCAGFNIEAAPILYGHNIFVLPAFTIPEFMVSFLNQIGKRNTTYLRELNFSFRRSEIWLMAEHRACNMFLPLYPTISNLQHLERLSFSEILDNLCIDYGDYDIRRQPSTDISILSFALQQIAKSFPRLSDDIHLGPSNQVSLISERLHSTYVRMHGLVQLKGHEPRIARLNYCLHRHGPREAEHCKVIKLKEHVDPIKDKISERFEVLYREYQIRSSTRGMFVD